MPGEGIGATRREEMWRGCGHIPFPDATIAVEGGNGFVRCPRTAIRGKSVRRALS